MMKWEKKFFCLFIVLLMILAVSAVSATEDSSDIIATDNSAIESEITLSQDNMDSQTTFAGDDLKTNGNNSENDNIVTKENFFNFFDSNGNYKNLNYTELYFKGDFDNLVDAITINTSLSISGLDANLNGMRFILTGNNIALCDLKIKSDSETILIDAKNAGDLIIKGNDLNAGSSTAINLYDSDAIIKSNSINTNSVAIAVVNGGVAIEDNEINVKDDASKDSYAIMAKNSDVYIHKNHIVYVGNSVGKTINNAICINGGMLPIILENNMNISIPSLKMEWKDNPSGSGNKMADSLSKGIYIDSSSANVEKNNISVEYNNEVFDDDVIFPVDIISDNANVSSNRIQAKSHDLIYTLRIIGNDFKIEKNDFFIDSIEEYEVIGIDVEGPSKGVVNDNKIKIIAGDKSYGIISGWSNNNISVDYLNNNLYCSAYHAYGMDLRGLKENVEGNIINNSAIGGYGIVSKSKDITVNNNIIFLHGDDHDATVESGFLAESGTALVTNNNITSHAKYSVVVEDISALVKDNYLISYEFAGDASVSYNPLTSRVYNNTPNKSKFFLSSEILEKYYGDAKKLEFKLTDASGNPSKDKTITIEINGIKYDRITDTNGIARMNINLDPDSYFAYATYTVDGSIVASNYAVIHILPTLEGKDIIKIHKNGTQYYAKFLDTKGNLLKNTDIKFNINGVYYTRTTNASGVARLNINLAPGKYTITSYNTNTGQQYSNSIVVLTSIVENKNLIKYYKNGSQYVVKVLDGQGNHIGAGHNVTFNINGVFYTRLTNASGHVKMNINLRPGEYVITADYNGCMVSNKITVLSILETEDLVMKYKDGHKFEVKVLDGQGNHIGAGENVTFNINGVFYTRTTGDDGIAKLNINLMPGNYIITSAYNGCSVGNKVTISG